MGNRGPIPERSDQRRRRNETGDVTEVGRDDALRGPELGMTLAMLAADWYEGLRTSAQAQYFEDSDWQMARILAWSLDNYLSSERPSSMMLASFLSGASSLLATEGDRRRVRMEIERNGPVVVNEAKVVALSKYHRGA